MAILPEIHRERCNGCGLCVDACARKVLIIIDDSLTIVEGTECGWCLVCEIVCPTDAITCPFEIVVEDNNQK